MCRARRRQSISAHAVVGREDVVPDGTGNGGSESGRFRVFTDQRRPETELELRLCSPEERLVDLG
jgi:hypothetical protein